MPRSTPTSGREHARISASAVARRSLKKMFTHRSASKVKANISSTIKAHLIRGAVYLFLLLAVCVIPIALGQRTTGEQSTTANMAQLSATSGDRGAGALAMPEFPMVGVWNQYYNPATEPPLGIGSQQFEPALNTLGDQVADDFVLTAPPPPMYLYIT
jgi:hypothetical protein